MVFHAGISSGLGHEFPELTWGHCHIQYSKISHKEQIRFQGLEKRILLLNEEGTKYSLVFNAKVSCLLNKMMRDMHWVLMLM